MSAITNANTSKIKDMIAEKEAYLFILNTINTTGETFFGLKWCHRIHINVSIPL